MSGSFSADYAARVLRPIDELIAAAVDKAADGFPKTEAEYRSLVGYIRGLREARAQIIKPLGAATGRQRPYA